MASKRRKRRKCQKKISYSERWRAVVSAKAQGLYGKISIYQCPTCRGWHLGHNNFGTLNRFLKGTL